MKPQNWELIGKRTWQTGLVLVAVGQTIATWSQRKGGTISEGVVSAPPPLKAAISAGLLMLWAHWFWGPPAVYIGNVETLEADNVTVEAAQVEAKEAS